MIKSYSGKKRNNKGQTDMICKYCGRQINNDAEYCSYCGRKVLRVPPVFTMTDIGTGVATNAIRSYSEWGFYNNPDAELDPETGQKRETEFDTLKTLPEENPLKWARDFMEADAAEAGAPETDTAVFRPLGIAARSSRLAGSLILMLC